MSKDKGSQYTHTRISYSDVVYNIDGNIAVYAVLYWYRILILRHRTRCLEAVEPAVLPASPARFIGQGPPLTVGTEVFCERRSARWTATKTKRCRHSGAEKLELGVDPIGTSIQAMTANNTSNGDEIRLLRRQPLIEVEIMLRDC